MSIRFMAAILRKLFKVAIVVAIVGFIAIGIEMARQGLFNFDKMWPFYLFL